MNFTIEEVKQFQKDIFIFDIHGHKDGLLPKIPSILNWKHIPKDIKLSDLSGTGVNGFIICALGDSNTFEIRKVDNYKTVLLQIEEIKKKISGVDGIIATTAQQISKAILEKKSVFVLGIEGGDFLEYNIERLTAVFDKGVRVLSLVHYSKNSLGSINFGWKGKVIPESEQTGLTQFGKDVVKKANELGILLDLAHADEKTILDVAGISNSPVICSHTGPRNLQNFPRYISDEALMAISSTCGMVGMWAFNSKGAGVKNINNFIEYTKYIINLIGIDHVGVGTDINGVPGNMKGYENLFDLCKVTHEFLCAGFTKDDMKKILGDNFLKLFKKIAK
jgi:membrane dipeptidase